LRVFMQGAATEPLGNGFVLMECYKWYKNGSTAG
jgi:hypothetical protein